MLCRYADMAKSMDNINDTMIPDTFSVFIKTKCSRVAACLRRCVENANGTKARWHDLYKIHWIPFYDKRVSLRVAETVDFKINI